jgi:YhcG PDDEXK nuclease domain
MCVADQNLPVLPRNLVLSRRFQIRLAYSTRTSVLRAVAPNKVLTAGRHITRDATEDLKLGKLTHADAGQMHLYLNYAREHWTLPGENPPVGLILCAERDHAVAKYALEGLPNKVLAAEY